MPFDYFSVELPESKKTGLNTMKIQQTLDRILFSLAMYPDFRLAEAFAGVSRATNILPFHLGEEIYTQIVKDVKERRKELKRQPLINIIGNLYDLWYEDYNIDELYKMVTGKQTIEDDDFPIEERIVVKSDEELIPSEHLTFANIIENMEMHVELESNFHAPDLDPGRWWLVWYDRKILQGRFRPFGLLARLNDEGKICYVQGVWPREYLMNALERIIPLGYKASHGDYVYLEIHAEMIDIKGKGRYQKYNLITRIDSPTG